MRAHQAQERGDLSRLLVEFARPAVGADFMSGMRTLSARLQSPNYRRSVGATN